MRYLWASATHQGLVRRNNEDSVWPANAGESEGPAVLMVADGMGGHIAGEVASTLAVTAASTADGEPEGRVAAANRAIREEVARRPDLEGMGTTLTLVELTPEGTAMLAHVGDSRAYLYREGSLTRLTEDHTVAAEYLALGQISAAEAEGHPQAHMLTRCLGLTPNVEPFRLDLDLMEGDRLLLASDGLTNMIEEVAIERAVGDGSPEEAAWRLVEMANAAGGQDNISVVVVDVAER